jgi:hypothetical protein
MGRRARGWLASHALRLRERALRLHWIVDPGSLGRWCSEPRQDDEPYVASAAEGSEFADDRFDAGLPTESPDSSGTATSDSMDDRLDSTDEEPNSASRRKVRIPRSRGSIPRTTNGILSG